MRTHVVIIQHLSSTSVRKKLTCGRNAKSKHVKNTEMFPSYFIHGLKTPSDVQPLLDSALSKYKNILARNQMISDRRRLHPDEVIELMELEIQIKTINVRDLKMKLSSQQTRTENLRKSYRDSQVEVERLKQKVAEYEEMFDKFFDYQRRYRSRARSRSRSRSRRGGDSHRSPSPRFPRRSSSISIRPPQQEGVKVERQTASSSYDR